MQQPLENEQDVQLQALQQQVHYAQPIFIQTTEANLAKMKAREDNEGLRVFANRQMNQQSTAIPFVMPLGGRGQDGFAGFIGNGDDSSNQYLIKIDDPATCILEGTARFAQSLLLPANRSSVNFANAGILKVTKEHGSETHVISVQDRVAPSTQGNEIKPWDVVVYGSKRNPKRPVSTEYFNQGNIKKNIGAMTEKAQWDLANAIFASTVVGDESLHVGQFMAETNPQGQVVGITRIDLGARERYGKARLDGQDFQHQTSALYKNSGQKGKDYISYLLNSPEVKQKYLSLWSRDINIDQAATDHVQALRDELAKLPEQEQNQALDDMLKTVYKKSDINIDDKLELGLDEKRTAVETLLFDITKARMTSMQASARKEMLKEIKTQFRNGGSQLTGQGLGIIKKLVNTSDENTVAQLKTMNKYLAGKAIHKDPAKIQYYQKIAQTIIERQSMAEHSGLDQGVKDQIKEQLLEMQQINQRMKMISKLSEYQTRLHSKFKNVDEKKAQVSLALRMLKTPSQEQGKFFHYEPSHALDAKFDQEVSKRRIGSNKTTPSKGALMVAELTQMKADYTKAKDDAGQLHQQILDNQEPEHDNALVV